MITGRHAKEEMIKARKVIEDKKTSVEQKLQALDKVVEVTLKVVLNIRTDVVKVMENLGIELVKPRKRDNEDTTTKSEEKTEE